MAETRGAASIVDRVEGWGHTAGGDSARKDDETWGALTEWFGDPTEDVDTVVSNTPTQTDATKEAVAARVARSLKARKSFKELIQSDVVDRTVGYGSENGFGNGADNYLGSIDDETPADLQDDADVHNGVFYDEDGDPQSGTGSNTANSTSDTDALVTARTAMDTDFQLLNDSSTEKRAEAVRISIIDRGFEDGVLTDGDFGWGHLDGDLDYRSDDD